MERHRFVVMELAANGFGPPEVLMKTRVDLIVNAYDYLRFKMEYQARAARMQRENG
jgi:hypothetical protein